VLEDGTRTLNDRRDDLIEDRKNSAKHNEDLRQQERAQDEIANKQLQSKLKRDRTEEV